MMRLLLNTGTCLRPAVPLQRWNEANAKTPEAIIVDTLISTNATLEELSDLTTFTKLRKFLTDYQLPLKYGHGAHYKGVILHLFN